MADIKQMGPTSWRVRVRVKGQPEVCRTFKSEREAVAFKKSSERGLKLGRPVAAAITVAECVRAFRKLREPGKPIKPGSTEHIMLCHIEDGIGSVQVDKLTPDRLADWCAERSADGAGPVTMGMEVSKLGTVLRYAAAWMHVTFPDVVGCARPLLAYQGLVGTSKRRERRPTPAELAAVLERLDPTMQDVVSFAVASAMRRGEIVRILWCDVDELRRLVMIRDRKHPRRKLNNHVWCPLIDATGIDAWALLQRQPRTDDRIFPLRAENVSDAFLVACRAAGVENLHFHDLRHEATSRLFESGLTIEQVAMVTGHSSWEDLKRYTQLRPESLTRGTRPDTLQRPDSLPNGHRLPHTS